MTIELIIHAIVAHHVRVSDHADEEAANDQLAFDEICTSVSRGEIIENYATDKPYPSCLIFGMNHDGEPIHSVWAFNEANGWVVLVTVYRPDPRLWIDWRTRRKRP